MKERATLIESLVESAEVYTKSSIDLLKLNAIDKSSKVFSSAVTTIIISIAVLTVTTMVNIGAALWINKLIQSSFCGFFIVAAFYSIITIVLFGFRKQLLKTPLLNWIINHIRKENNI